MGKKYLLFFWTFYISPNLRIRYWMDVEKFWFLKNTKIEAIIIITITILKIGKTSQFKGGHQKMKERAANRSLKPAGIQRPQKLHPL